MDDEPARGRLTLAATPIGNALDASERLRELLASADVVAAEDTRRALALAGRLGIAIGGTLISLHEHNEAHRTRELLERMERGQHVVVVSDAGMPLVSDPGARLVRAAIAAGLPVTCAPGPSAVLTALALSGLETSRFAFEGFFPRRDKERAAALAMLRTEERTSVWFESPRRLPTTLQLLAAALPADRRAAVARELTKTHEEVRRGRLADLAEWASEGVLGEIVLVISGAPAAAVSLPDLAREAAQRAADGERLKDVARELAEATRASAREIYDAALRHRP